MVPRVRSWAWLGAALLVAAVATPAVRPEAARAAFPGENGLIAFTRQVSGNDEIFIVAPDGSGLRNLTDHPANDSQPAWSPDGTRIAFTSDRTGDYELYVMNADGSNVRRLTNSPATFDGQPSWSANGRRIAFTREGAGEQAIYWVAADGGTPQRLVNGAHDPAYSPDGTRLAYSAYRSGDDSAEIYVRTLSSGTEQQITWNTRVDTDPEWSPDGTMVAVSRFDQSGDGMTDEEVWLVEEHGYNEDRLVGPEAMWPGWSPDGTRVAYAAWNGSDWDLYVVPPVPGSSPTRLTSGAAHDTEPSWQPSPAVSGEGVIAFTSTRDGNPEIYVMNADGTAQTRVTDHVAMDAYPAISPDGSRIAFTSWRDGDAEIYVVNLDGTGLTKITSNTAYDAEPTWSPDGAALMYVSDRSGSSRLWFTVLADGTTFGPYGKGGSVSNFSPDWGGDGVVYVSDRDGDNELYFFVPEGTVTVKLTSSPQSDYGPAWAPRLPGARFHVLAFVRGAPAEGDLFQLSMPEIPSPGDPVPTPARLTRTDAWESSPTWRGDAAWLAFARATTPGDISTAEIWAMDAEGREIQLTRTEGANYDPDWGPCTLDAENTCGTVAAPPTYARSVTLDLARHLVASGRVGCTAGATACVGGVRVKIQRRTSSGWTLVERARTGDDGRYRARIPDRPGTYRAVVPWTSGIGFGCEPATSRTVRHSH